MSDGYSNRQHEDDTGSDSSGSSASTGGTGAGIIAAMFGSIVGESGPNTPRSAWSSIYHALDQVKGVRWPTHGGHGVKIIEQQTGKPVSIRLEWRKG